MPKIFEYFGLIFFVYTEDHLPIHVHVKYAEQFIRAFDKSIVEKWNRIMVYHLPVDYEKITKKLK